MKVMKALIIIVSLIVIGVIVFYFKPVKNKPEPKKIVAKSIFGSEGKAFGEFNHPTSLAIKDNYLFVGDGGNNRIQILKINPDGSLTAQSVFGKEGKGLGEFGIIESIVIKDGYLYVSDWGRQCIHIMEIKYN